MTKVKAKKAEKGEIFIVKSGSHSRKENGIVTKYECGDQLELSDKELAQFPMKFITLDEYQAIIEADERRRREDRRMQRAQFPPAVRKKRERDSESIKRQKRLLKIQHRSSARTYMG